MENPMLTFITNIIAGDRSMTDVIAHELAHSWTGNLVSCQTFDSFWLSEGWTVYLERMILKVAYDDDFRNFMASLGWKDLEEAIDEFGEDSEYTKLQPRIRDVDPDDVFSSVPYGILYIYFLRRKRR